MKAVLNCIGPKISERSGEYWELTIEGVSKPVIAFKEKKQGDLIDESLLQLSPRKDVYYLRTGKDVKPKQASTDTMMAMSVFRAICELAAADKFQIFSKKGRYRSEQVEELGRQMMESIKRIQEGPGVPAVKGDRAGTDNPSAAKTEPGSP